MSTSKVPSLSLMFRMRSPVPSVERAVRVVSYVTCMPEIWAKRPCAEPPGVDAATECSIRSLSCAAFMAGAVFTRLVKGSTLKVSPVVTLPGPAMLVRIPPPFWMATSAPPAKRIASATRLPRPVSALRTPSVYSHGSGVQATWVGPLSLVAVVPMISALRAAMKLETGVITEACRAGSPLTRSGSAAAPETRIMRVASTAATAPVVSSMSSWTSPT
ncbi:hypothetical protein FQZ97_840660 [compost metagenome]